MAIETIKLMPRNIGGLIADGIGDAAEMIRELSAWPYVGLMTDEEKGRAVVDYIGDRMYSHVAGKRIQTGCRIPRKRYLLDSRACFDGIRDEFLLRLSHSPAVHDAAILTVSCCWRNSMRASEEAACMIRATPRRYRSKWPEPKIQPWAPEVISPEADQGVVALTTVALTFALTIERLAASKAEGYFFPLRGLKNPAGKSLAEVDAMIARGLSDRDVAARTGKSRSFVLRRRRAIKAQ